MSQKITIVLVAIIAMSAGFWFSNDLKTSDTNPSDSIAQKPKINGFFFNPERIIAIPPLLKDDGSAFTNDDVKNHWSLLFFGYTHCPDVCPTTMNVLAQSALLAKEKNIKFPDVYFISVDPQRDSAEMLGEYVRYFDTSFTGVTGEAKMIEALTLQTGVVFMQAPTTTTDKENYIVDHSASILVMNPDGKLTASLRAPHSAEGILSSLKIIRQ